MKIISLFLIILFSLNHCSNENSKTISLRQLHPRNPFDRLEELENEEKKLVKEYEEKMKENDELTQKIAKKIKYIKILVSTGFLKLIATILLITKIYSKFQKKNIYQNPKKNISIRNNEINLKDNGKNNISLESNQSSILSTSISSIQKSSYNLLNSNSKLGVNMGNDNVSIYQISEQSNNDSFAGKENESEKNFDAPNAPKIEDDSNVVVNDDNKTLTNNPDVFIQSRMDKILYKPYSEEEIKK